MKPQKLIMSAFGSYAGEEVVDFSKTNHGIFLITGDTGAGKTTIFDAICYALYDRTSGGARESSDMRSQYAGAETPTFVEYTFTYGTDTYVIKRNPKYSRLSKRKDKDGNYKETIEQPSVELIMPDGRVFPGKLKETNEKIMEIIGLDADQFTQIAMIAQGDFMKLLQASSNKRKEIFAKIFDTKIYWQLQDELRRKTKGIYGELEDNRKYCEQELGSIRVLSDMGDETEPFVFQEHATTELLARLDVLLEVGKTREAENKVRLEEAQQQIEEKNNVLSEAKQINVLWEQLEQAVVEKEMLEAKKEEMLSKEKQLEQAKRAAVVRTEEEKHQAGKRVRQDSEKRLSSYQLAREELASSIFMLAEKKEIANRQKAEKEPVYQQQILRIEDTLVLYEQAQEMEKESHKLTKELVDLETAVIDKQKQFGKAQKELIHMHEQAGQALQSYQQANDAFIAEQAGIMAATLQENEPCPVCGSTTHPKKAKLSDTAVTQQQVNQAKEIWQQREEKERLWSEKITHLRDELEKMNQEQLAKKGSVESIKVQLEQLQKNLTFPTKQEAQKAVKDLKTNLQELQNQTRQAEEAWQKSSQEQAVLSDRIEVETEQQKRFVQEEKELLEQYHKVLREQGFVDEKAYQNAFCTEEQRQALEQEKTAYHEMCVRNEEKVKQLKLQTKNREKKNTLLLSEELMGLQQERKQLEEVSKVLYGVNQRNEEAYQKLKKAFAKREQLKQQYQLYSGLDKTANGNLSGSAKLDFQTFIQRRFFERIIHEANKRLIKMTSNQFILQCRSLDKLSSQGAVGLDLDVYSLINDRTRDVKTLSGGESFMAALAMALGMSDVIQNTAGRVKLETMFVDEGFGSLDDEARGEAIKILQELAGNKRLVGIISHVTELKEQIDCKLIVTKDEQGSTVAWSMEG